MRWMVLAATITVALAATPLRAQENGEPVPSQCIAMAETLPNVIYANLTPGMIQAQATDETVSITYAGHSTYVIETPGGVRLATDYSGVYGHTPLPRVVTMNKAHRTHYTDTPDGGIEHVLRGWNPGGGPARHAIVVDDVYIRNVPTDIQRWGQEEKDGNSIFIFEVAGLCIGHLGHLHHRLDPKHYAAIGRLDVVMAPVDGGMTLALETVTEITRRLQSSIVLPMHRHATPIDEFLSPLRGTFDIDFRAARTLDVSMRTLPRRPTIVILDGV